jgi:hypothetical protein
MMKWAKERDLLIAQTMAFVQSIAGSAKPSEIETRAKARIELAPVEFTAAKFVSSDEIEKVERPVEVVPVMRPRPLPRSDIREEIQGRVAAFRAHQQLFDRDRDAYFNSVLARLRASAPSQPKAPRGPIR